LMFRWRLRKTILNCTKTQRSQLLHSARRHGQKQFTVSCFIQSVFPNQWSTA
jgi:hypothetical protein